LLVAHALDDLVDGGVCWCQVDEGDYASLFPSNGARRLA
jgi:hypothetical protein